MVVPFGKFIPAGYMAKTVVTRPNWIEAPHVREIFSVSNCVSDDFCDFISFWKHNGYWLFDSPSVIQTVAHEAGVSLDGMRLFFYEAFDHECDHRNDANYWLPFKPEESFDTDIQAPAEKRLEGFDVVTFSVHTSPECSPLSCNSLAATIAVNENCLLRSFEEAYSLLESGAFENSEPGPYRIFAVYSVGTFPL